MRTLFTQLQQDECGATAVEYGLIVALIFLAIITAVGGTADNTNIMWEYVGTNVTDAINGM